MVPRGPGGAGGPPAAQQWLENLLADGKLPSRRDQDSNGEESALASIMSEVDELSRDRDPGAEGD